MLALGGMKEGMWIVMMSRVGFVAGLGWDIIKRCNVGMVTQRDPEPEADKVGGGGGCGVNGVGVVVVLGGCGTVTIATTIVMIEIALAIVHGVVALSRWESWYDGFIVVRLGDFKVVVGANWRGRMGL